MQIIINKMQKRKYKFDSGYTIMLLETETYLIKFDLVFAKNYKVLKTLKLSFAFILQPNASLWFDKNSSMTKVY